MKFLSESWITDAEEIQNMYFEEPTQLMFIDEYNEFDKLDTEYAVGGIAYKNEIICGECGAIVDLEDVFAVYVFGDWVSLNEAISGDDMSINKEVE